MKVILIDNKDCKALVDKLMLDELDPLDMMVEDVVRIHNLPKIAVKSLAREMHRKFYYHVIQWLQAQGADV